MADRVSASIVLGGTITPAAFAQLTALVEQEGLSTEWDGEPFQPGGHRPGEPLSLYAHEVAWCRFEGLEEWCTVNGVQFVRWSGAYGNGAPSASSSPVWAHRHPLPPTKTITS